MPIACVKSFLKIYIKTKDCIQNVQRSAVNTHPQMIYIISVSRSNNCPPPHPMIILKRELQNSSKPVLFSINGLGRLLIHPFFKRKTQNIATIIVLLMGTFLKGCNDQMNEHPGVLCTLQHSTTAICLLTLMQYPCLVLIVKLNVTCLGWTICEEV